MKKSIVFVIIILFTSMLIWDYNKDTNGEIIGAKAQEINKSADQKDIAEKIIRFHILANSDSNEDQALKLKVRDKILAYISPKLSDSKNIQQSREILKKYDKDINEIAENTIKENGYNYSVKTELSYVDFPVKLYGSILLPQGRYEAYRILIGNAKGHNWWCVMFPPLCFTDITKGNIEDEKTEKEMKSVLTNEEYELINNNPSENSNSSNEDNVSNSSNGNAGNNNINNTANNIENHSTTNNKINNNNSSKTNNSVSNKHKIKKASNNLSKNTSNKVSSNSGNAPVNINRNNLNTENNQQANVSNNAGNNSDTGTNKSDTNKNSNNNQDITNNSIKNNENVNKNNSSDNKIIVKFKLVEEFKKLGSIIESNI